MSRDGFSADAMPQHARSAHTVIPAVLAICTIISQTAGGGGFLGLHYADAHLPVARRICGGGNCKPREPGGWFRSVDQQRAKFVAAYSHGLRVEGGYSGYGRRMRGPSSSSFLSAAPR